MREGKWYITVKEESVGGYAAREEGALHVVAALHENEVTPVPLH